MHTSCAARLLFWTDAGVAGLRRHGVACAYAIAPACAYAHLELSWACLKPFRGHLDYLGEPFAHLAAALGQFG